MVHEINHERMEIINNIYPDLPTLIFFFLELLEIDLLSQPSSKSLLVMSKTSCAKRDP